MGFPIQTPDGAKYLPYRYKMSYQEKKEHVNEVINNYKEYINNNRDSSVVKKMAYSLGSYLFKDESDTNVNSYKKHKSIKKREIPVSSLINSSYNDLFYSSVADDEECNIYAGVQSANNENFIDYTKYLVNEFYEESKSNRDLSRWQETNAYKLSLLHSCDDKYEYVTNDEIIEYKVGAEELEAFLKNTPKFERDIKAKKILTHKGRKGIIDKGVKYISDYVYVDNTNKFIFNESKFEIDNSLEQYKVINEKSQMDSIICYYIADKDKYYFFDQNINEITDYVYMIDT